MAETITAGIRNSWSLLAFAQAHGKMQIAPCKSTDEQTGEVKNFKSCVFTDPNDSTNRVFVAFSSKLGELTPTEISSRKAELQVVQLDNEKGNYYLCKKGESSWADVEL